ncbi:MAG: extracellular solute-binding protein [Acidobacteriota bacterium]|nr:extracellular solute-binding protein [Acidobacteriota bacterium]MDE3043260.1 extracellular solute-binding protein [Acidobacteriota bacterium]MDE3106582.1 extracellular solute-binding protein [Acidobacteriota bacterium]MDE3222181.1 extracellular solute-binding protein [Acidobacteriota bacterium]
MGRLPRWTLVVVATLGVVTTGSFTASASSTRGGVVDVLYAGSLTNVMTNHLIPAFTRATGIRVVSVSNGSSALASEIRGKTQVGDVFLSAAASSDRELQGASNGNWVTTYTTFASSPLVLAYNPQSPFAGALRTRPWYEVVTRAGFLLGRTDPATDPKGVLAIEALREAAARYHLPQLARLTRVHDGVFDETALVGELEAGQLDAGFFYEVEARAANLPTRPLTGTRLEGTYTVAVLNRAPHLTAARAFRSYLLSNAGRALLRAYGLTPTPLTP